MTRLRFIPLSLLPLALGCAEDITCPAWSFPAVVVHLESATSASAIIAALGEVRDGQYRDSLLDFGDGSYMAAENRPGTYCPTVETEVLEVRLEVVP